MRKEIGNKVVLFGTSQDIENAEKVMIVYGHNSDIRQLTKMVF